MSTIPVPAAARWAAAFAALSSLAACGGASTPATPSATPTPVVVATPTPTPAPTPTPTPANGLAPGPVASVKAYLKTVETTRNSREYRTSIDKDAEGRFILYVGEYVVVDSTQRNANGEICQWRRDPIYYWDNFDDMMDIKGSSEPFFFKFEVARPGVAEISSSIDGVPSNDLKIVAIRRPN